MEVSHFCRTGNSLTLARRLGDMLYKAEEEFGQRDQSWTVLGIEFEGSTPCLWFPKPGKGIVIKLGESALDNTVTACYQLAHECIHLLSPCGSSVVPVIEEGLATVYSESYIAHALSYQYNTPEVPYANAAALVRELLSIAPGAIAKLRSVEPAFTKLTEQTFVEAGVEAPTSLIAKLLSPFRNS